MEVLQSQIVLTPFLSPPPADKNRAYPSIEIKDTLNTLFLGFDSHYISDAREFKLMLDSLERNIPIIVRLQAEKLDEGSPPNLYSTNIPLWIRHLADPTVSLFSLVPIPNLGALKLKSLIKECLDMKIPPDRAAWAIHNYAKNKNVTPDKITKKLMEYPAFFTNNPDYFSKLGHALYMKNLVIHSQFLVWMIQNLPPENLLIFKKELLKTHSLLYHAFNSPGSLTYINAFKDDLMLDKSQLIQFSIISQTQTNKFQKDLDPFLSKEIKQRVTAICNLTLSQLAFSSVLRNILFLGFPYYIPNSFAEDLKKMVLFSDDDMINEHVQIMFKSLLWFDHCLPAVSTIVAFMINVLINQIKKIVFPLREFIEIIYNNISKVHNFTFLFIELQDYKFFSYADFLKTIHQRGFFFSRKDETFKVISQLPCSSSMKADFNALNTAMRRLFPKNEYTKLMCTILEDVEDHLDLLSQLPFVYQYLVALNTVKKTSDFLKTAKFVSNLGAPNLIVQLFERTQNNELAADFSIEIRSIIEDLIPCFSTHNLLSSLAAYACSQASNPICKDIVLYLFDHYYKSSICLRPHKSTISDIAKNLSKPDINIDQIIAIFNKYTYYCSLHVYDAFYTVKTMKDFSTTMTAFLHDLLNYTLLGVDGLFQFFIDFSQSNCVNRPSQFFIKMLISVIVRSYEFAENKRIESILEKFFARAMRLKIIDPSHFLETIFGICKKPKGRLHPQPTALMLVHIFIKILNEELTILSVESILTESIVKGFIQSFPPEANPLKELLLILRSFPPPIITNDAKIAIESNNSIGMTYPAALFSLLPTQMQATDFVDVFDYFKANVDRTTSTFWTLWLELRPAFVPGFPVTAIQPEKEAIVAYRGTLISAFSSLLYHSQPGDEKTLVYLNCWTLLCDDITFSKVIVENTINDLQTMKLPLCPMMITFLNPSLMVIYVKTFESLCDSFLKYCFDEVHFEEYALLAASVFAVFVSRFPDNIETIPAIAEKVLEWIPRLYMLKSAALEKIIDVFNFILCFSNDKHKENDVALQERIHESIRGSLEKIPEDISRFIIVNIPPQQNKKVKDPLYSGFELKEPEPEQPPQPYQPPEDHDHDNAFTAQFDNSSMFPQFIYDEFNGWF